MPALPVQKRKGHLAITASYPGLLRYQVVELGYMKSAHSVAADSVACNLQPRLSGQIIIGSSRQFGADDPAVEDAIHNRMLRRTFEYVPALEQCHIVRAWTGFRPATPDKLPLIGPVTSDSTLWLATGHEGLGITASLATAELIADSFSNRTPAIPAEPYLPTRLLEQHTASATSAANTYTQEPR
jgi:glycine/D-amino acid oxidase-like deaminating enzyme